jgi:ABC-type nitrate/sulfonate/bicarbonate transport system permease component
MIPNWLSAIRGQVPRKVAVFLGMIPIAGLLVVWYFLTNGQVEERIIAPSILPSPREVWDSVGELIYRRDLVHHILASLQRVGLSYLLALVCMLPLGILMGSFGVVRSMFTPITTASGYIPIATLVPLTMAWFGTDEKQKIVFLAIAFAIYLLPMIIQAIDSVPEIYLKTSYTLGSTKLETVFHVLIPVAMPDIWHGMRLAFGVGWTYLVLAEVVVFTDGLGFLVAFSQRRGPREHIYLVILVIAIIAWIADLIWSYLGNLLFPYKRSRT